MEAKGSDEESQPSYNDTTRTLSGNFAGGGAILDEQSPDGHLVANQLAAAEGLG